ncbi:hypothetical protein PFISCL1PPCAC_6703 [Pristionchus fissidentatus]|uniref:Uncharacterized protein n=1 Tax=Pristionchus fissidentatus TaxID=1538716 RepID=A0AAV5V6Z7_9BILA|nr:hypothetical protein PFISCL1PPCAC_6703 [Pristionchus fissidentatus]
MAGPAAAVFVAAKSSRGGSVDHEQKYEMDRMRRQVAIEKEQRIAGEEKIKELEKTLHRLKEERARDRSEVYDVKKRLVDAELSAMKWKTTSEEMEKKKTIESPLASRDQSIVDTYRRCKEENRELKKEVAELSEKIFAAERLAASRMKTEKTRGTLEAANLRLTEEIRGLTAKVMEAEQKVSENEELQADLKLLKGEVETLNRMNFQLSTQLAEAERAATAANEDAAAANDAAETASKAAAAAEANADRARKEAEKERKKEEVASAAAAKYKLAAEEAGRAAEAARTAMELAVPSVSAPFAAAPRTANNSAMIVENMNLRATADQLRVDRDYWKREHAQAAKDCARYKEREQRYKGRGTSCAAGPPMDP